MALKNLVKERSTPASTENHTHTGLMTCILETYLFGEDAGSLCLKLLIIERNVNQKEASLGIMSLGLFLG